MCGFISTKNVLYVSGEESVRQTKLRAERLVEDSGELNVYAETNLEIIHSMVQKENQMY